MLRDNQLSSEESNIPLVFQKILDELTTRGVKEEGILRVGGHKQKVPLYSIQQLLYQCEQSTIQNCKLCITIVWFQGWNIVLRIGEWLLLQASGDGQTVQKNSLSWFISRFEETPTWSTSTVAHCWTYWCILSNSWYWKDFHFANKKQKFNLIFVTNSGLFSGIKNPSDLAHALNLLVLLLPVEHRCTLKALLTFLKLVVDNQVFNKMSIHNVAMIVAPSLFPPRYIYPRDRTDLTAQVNMAAVCCQVTEALLNNINRLWHVPRELIDQLRRQTEEERYRRFKKKY